MKSYLALMVLLLCGSLLGTAALLAPRLSDVAQTLKAPQLSAPPAEILPDLSSANACWPTE